MADDILTAMLTALDKPRTPVKTTARTPDQNTPYQPVPVRAERRTPRSYADPTGETAIGNRKRQR